MASETLRGEADFSYDMTKPPLTVIFRGSRVQMIVNFFPPYNASKGAASSSAKSTKLADCRSLSILRGFRASRKPPLAAVEVAIGWIIHSALRLEGSSRIQNPASSHFSQSSDFRFGRKSCAKSCFSRKSSRIAQVASKLPLPLLGLRSCTRLFVAPTRNDETGAV